ncbi:MAG: hypothetical protein ABMA15_03135 [Vicinamibacterales bacterium]
MTSEPNASARVQRPLRARVALGFALLVVTVASSPGRAQTPGAASAAATHLTIPYLASTKAGDIEFAAAECDVAQSGEQMTCRFRQVFVTIASIDTTACVITSNGYEQTFSRNTPTHWLSVSEPSGECGLVESTTLEDGGGTRWTMTIETKPTRGKDRDECRAAERPAVYSWTDIKRTLPCTTIQPGSIER